MGGLDSFATAQGRPALPGHDLLLALLQGLPHAAWVVDLATGLVVAANPEATTLFGRSAESLQGAAAEALLASPEDLAWWEAARRGETAPLHSDTLVCTRDNGSLHVSRSIRTLALAASAPDASPAQPSHALVMVADRAAEKQQDFERESLLSELQATLEATADGILVTDPDGSLR